MVMFTECDAELSIAVKTKHGCHQISIEYAMS